MALGGDHVVLWAEFEGRRGTHVKRHVKIHEDARLSVHLVLHCLVNSRPTSNSEVSLSCTVNRALRSTTLSQYKNSNQKGKSRCQVQIKMLLKFTRSNQGKTKHSVPQRILFSSVVCISVYARVIN